MHCLEIDMNKRISLSSVIAVKWKFSKASSEKKKKFLWMSLLSQTSEITIISKLCDTIRDLNLVVAFGTI